jgi:hypothetical protein
LSDSFKRVLRLSDVFRPLRRIVTLAASGIFAGEGLGTVGTFRRGAHVENRRISEGSGMKSGRNVERRFIGKMTKKIPASSPATGLDIQSKSLLLAGARVISDLSKPKFRRKFRKAVGRFHLYDCLRRSAHKVT